MTGKYENDAWISSDHSVDEWYIAYHGVRAESNMSGIISKILDNGNKLLSVLHEIYRSSCRTKLSL